jgi:hypothetical protein
VLNNSKEDFANYLKRALCACSKWREQQANRYPTDEARNRKAAARLAELASEISVPDSVWSDIGPHYNEASSRFVAAVSDSNRDVEFRRHPKDFSAYLQNLSSNLVRR